MSIYQNEEEFMGMEISPYIKDYVDYNLAISTYVHTLLEQKGWTQKDLAQAIGKTEGEISKWLSGMHNLTLKSIAKMSAVLGEKLIYTLNELQDKNLLLENIPCDSGINDDELEELLAEVPITFEPM